MSRTLIKGGSVLTMGRSNLPVGDVLIDGDVVAEVGEGLRARDAEVVDATGCIVMPGFVDGHRRLWRSLLANVGTALEDPEFARHHGADDVHAATALGLLGAVDAGITTIADWCSVADDPTKVDAALTAHTGSGVRTVFVHGGPADGWRDGLARTAGLELGPLTRLAAGLPSMEESDEWAAARDAGLRVHVRVGTRGSDEGRVAGLAGHLGADTTLVHTTTLGDADLDAIAAAGASVVLAPSAEMAEGLGPPDIQRYIDKGIRPGLGVDHEGLAPGDAFAPMRAAISLQHATYFDLKLAGKAGLPRLLTTREVIRWATVDGARALGLGEVTGTIEPGRQADVIVLRTDRPNLHPINDAIGAVVWGADTSNIDWVFVAGRALKRDGLLVADVAATRTAALEAHRRVAGASGLLAQAGGAA